MELKCNCSELPHHPLCLEATRPTAVLGDDGELVEALGDVLDIIAAAQMQFSQTDEHKAYYSKRREQVQQARDRLILYREAREKLANALLAGTLSMSGRRVRIEFETREDAEAMFEALGDVLSRSA